VIAAAVLAIMSMLVSPLTPVASAFRARSMDRVWRASAPDVPSGIVADRAGAVVRGPGDIRATGPDGKEQWSASFGDTARLGPLAVSKDLVVTSTDGERYLALSRVDGHQQWEHAAANAWAVAIDANAGHPLVGTVSLDGVLEVLDGTTGIGRWSTHLRIVDHLGVVKLWLRRGRAIVAWNDAEASRIRAYDVENGQLVWADDRDSFSTLPAVSSRVVAFAVNDGRRNPRRLRGRVHGLDPTTGTELWARDVRGLFVPTLVGAASSRVVAVVDLKGTVTTMDARTGKLRWRKKTRLRQAEAQPRIVGAVITMTTYGTGLQVLDAHDGSAVANDEPGPVQTEATIVASAGAGRRLYVIVQIGRSRGELWMLEPAGR
jgi:outer membrane protein assembly factor BamB